MNGFPPIDKRTFVPVETPRAWLLSGTVQPKSAQLPGQEGSVRAIRLSPADLFDAAQIVTDGRPLRAFRIVCAGCGATAVARMNSMRFSNDGNEKEDRQASQKFKKMGWTVGRKPDGHRCPQCAEHETPAPKQPAPKKEKPMAATVTNLPNAPKTMSREDRRIIFEKLNEVYVDEKTGYADEWTDKAVAAHLGVPMAWISGVREEMFGPVASNPKIDEQLAKASGLAEELRTTAAALLQAATDIDRRLADIQKRVRP